MQCCCSTMGNHEEVVSHSSEKMHELILEQPLHQYCQITVVVMLTRWQME